MTPTARMDLELRLQTGGMSRYGRLRFLIRPGCPKILGDLVDQSGERVEWLVMPALSALVEAGEQAGQTFQVRIDRVWVHAVDTRAEDFGVLLRGAVRLAARHGLGGDRAWGEAWAPARWFRVRCVRL